MRSWFLFWWLPIDPMMASLVKNNAVVLCMPSRMLSLFVSAHPQVAGMGTSAPIKEIQGGGGVNKAAYSATVKRQQWMLVSMRA